MKKIKIFIGFIVLFLLAISTQVLAAGTAPATTTKTPPTEAILLATVNIESPKIISQERDIIKISFNLSNREGLQTGVKYGVKLLKEVKNGDKVIKYVVNEKIYDESLTLNPNTKTPVEITYEAPTYLSGE